MDFTMIKVLQKTFDVMEYVVSRERPVPASEVVFRLKLAHPTCIRILKDLVELGYLEQAGARKGYQAGPLAAFPGGRKQSRNDFIGRAAPLIEECARKLGQSVLLAIRHRSWRHIPCCSNFNPDFSYDLDQVRHHDLYCTVSGRLLLACADEKEQDEIIDVLPPPDADRSSLQYWPEAQGGRENVKRELAAIRRDGAAEMPVSKCRQFHCFALPVFQDNVFFGALAANWPAGSGEALSGSCRDAMRQLADRLSIPATFSKVIVG